MTAYNSIDEFEGYMTDNWVRQLTVVEYARRGGIWSRKTGEFARRPEFRVGYQAWVRIRLHEDLEDPYTRTIECFLTCEYPEQISFEPSEDGKTGVLHGFTRDGYRVDIVAHARTR